MEIHKTVDIELEIDPKVYILDGHVTCGGQPIIGCVISFHNNITGDDANDVVTNEIGYYRLEFLPGEWVLTAIADGYKIKTLTFNVP